MSIQCTNRVWTHSTQRGAALLLLVAIAGYADDHGFAFPGQRTLAARTRMSVRHTRPPPSSNLRELCGSFAPDPSRHRPQPRSAPSTVPDPGRHSPISTILPPRPGWSRELFQKRRGLDPSPSPPGSENLELAFCTGSAIMGPTVTRAAGASFGMIRPAPAKELN
jgi:hypothetical protein